MKRLKNKKKYKKKPYISTHSKKRQRKNRILLFSIILILLIIVLLIIFIPKSIKKEKMNPKKIENINLLIDQNDYKTIFEIASNNLKLESSNNYWLRLHGFAAYQLAGNYGINQNKNFEKQQELLDIAISDFKKSRILRKDKDLEEIEILLGKSFYAKGPLFMDSAIFHFKNALSLIDLGRSNIPEKLLEENLRTIYYYLGSAYSQLGDYDKSINYFLKVEGEIRNSLYIAVSFYKNKNYIKAYQYLEEVINNSSDNNLKASCLNWKAKIYFEEGKFDQAIEIYEKLIENFPQSPDPLFKIGMIYYKMNNRVKARAYFRKAATKNTPCPKANEALLTLF